MANILLAKRGTRAQLNAAATANGLHAGEPYLITDEARLAVVLVSIRNLDNVTWPVSRSYVDGVREVVGLCRDRAVVVLGGSGFSLEPRALLAATGAHCGVVGEGEERGKGG